MANTDAQSISSFFTGLKSVYANDDIDWVKFVNDHYQIIFASCTYEHIDPSKHYWETYRLEDYLRDINFDPNAAWIVLLVNQMSSNHDFKNVDGLLIPNLNIIRTLRQSFIQYRSHIKSIRP